LIEHVSLFFVQVRPCASWRWATVAVAGSWAAAACGAERHWASVVGLLGSETEYRVVSDTDLERTGGGEAVGQAVASLHAETFRAMSWLRLHDAA
jgi:hypothetical protein